MITKLPCDPGPDFPRILRMIVEIPRDSTNKYEYDHVLGLFKVARALYSPMHYPGDYGFIPGTIAEDGEPLDVLSLVSVPSFTGCLCYVRPIAVLDMYEESGPDHKIIAVPHNDPRHEGVNSLDDIPPHRMREIEHFFEIYKELEGKRMRREGWRGVDDAIRTIEESRSRFLEPAAGSAA